MKAADATADFLLGDTEDTLTNETVASLGSTADAFATRLRRKLKEQEKLEDELSKACEARHAAMMKAMMTIRKALQETCKTDLGKRFSFDLDVSDHEGWPRIELNLVDELLPERIDYGLIVSANDRNELGAILINNKHNGELLGRIQLALPGELSKLPTMLKTALRRFLDIVAHYVLNPISQKAILEEKAMELEDTEVVRDASISAEEMFVEDGSIHDQNRVDTGGPSDSISLMEKE